MKAYRDREAKNHDWRRFFILAATRVLSPVVPVLITIFILFAVLLMLHCWVTVPPPPTKRAKWCQSRGLICFIVTSKCWTVPLDIALYHFVFSIIGSCLFGIWTFEDDMDFQRLTITTVCSYCPAWRLHRAYIADIFPAIRLSHVTYISQIKSCHIALSLTFLSVSSMQANTVIFLIIQMRRHINQNYPHDDYFYDRVHEGDVLNFRLGRHNWK